MLTDEDIIRGKNLIIEMIEHHKSQALFSPLRHVTLLDIRDALCELLQKRNSDNNKGES